MTLSWRKLRYVFFLTLLLATWALDVYHTGVFREPDRVHGIGSPGKASQWISKEKYGINQLILQGDPFERGLEEGRKTTALLYQQEKELTGKLQEFIPNSVFRNLFELFLLRWFSGIEPYFEPWMVQEMYGISRSSSHDFDFMADRLTRQIAYHGLHEVGQMMVDQGSEDMGCTVVALPFQGSWIIGRNFDFEGGRIFDTEKIMKWIYPDTGYAFVSVIWAGMVGVVTGVNEKGVYVSLNAAGSRDMRRLGTPSTLVLRKALQFSKTAEEAVHILENETMFITDIFVVSDRTSSKIYRVEKSPKHTETLVSSSPTVVTNHLVSPYWANDSVNVYRRTELTSSIRASQGERLLGQLSKQPGSAREAELKILGILRDKGGNRDILLGNRQAIDALIAVHSVVFNAPENLLYVSQGPGVSGRFIGFDLTRSFATRTPIVVGSLPADPLVSPETFSKIRTNAKTLLRLEHEIRQGSCVGAGSALKQNQFGGTYQYYTVYGDYQKCVGDPAGAKLAWKQALQLMPAYPREIRALRERLNP